MPAEVHFLRERSTLLFTYDDPLTIEDIDASLEVYYPLLDEVRTTVHSIFDVTRLALLPPQLMSTFIARRSAYQPIVTHPMLGISVVVTSNSTVSSVVYIAAHIFSTKKIRMVHTLDAAWPEIDRLRHR